MTASAVVARVGDFHQFKNGAQFGARLGLTPRQNPSGGKNSLGGITTRGDLISKWLYQLREKSGWQKAAVAMANKNARILWAMMAKGCSYDPRHVSVKPTGPVVTMA